MGETKAPTENDPLLGGRGTTADADEAAPPPPPEAVSWLQTHEERRRHRMILAMALLSSFLAVVSALLIWRLYVAQKVFHAELPTMLAAQALDRLNHHIHKQSKHIAVGCESTLLLLRHCEKIGPYVEDAIDFDTTNQHCSYLGYERAAHFATLFGNHPRYRWPKPAHLFALTPQRSLHLNFREWETLQPLSKRSGIVTEIANQESLPKLYFELLQSGSMCGRVSVVTWKHEHIPELARALACGPDNGCPDSYPDDSFDIVWQLKYVFHPDIKDEIKDSTNITSVINNSNSTAAVQEIGDDDENPPNLRSRGRRRLMHHTKPFSKHGWNVYATVSYQNFDPLAYSKSVGDYNHKTIGATESGGRWKQGGGPPQNPDRQLRIQYEEEENVHDDEM